MQEYIIKRLLWVIPTLLIVLTILFFFFQVIPGDPIQAAFGGPEGSALTEEQLAHLRNELGLDRPLYVRYFDWLWDFLRLDLGVSIVTGGDVWEEVAVRLPYTATLVGMAVLITIIFSIPLGILCAFYQDRWPDYVLRIMALLWLSMPAFWVGIMVILVLVTVWRWFPPMDYATIFTDPWLTLQQLFFPALILGVRPVGVAIRLIRSSLLEVFREDYLRTARAKGLFERAVMTRHALPNALIPVTTYYGLEIILLVGTAILIEKVFAIPGLGTLTVYAVTVRDVYLMQGSILFLLLLSLAVNLVVDVLYGVIDPRVRYGKH